MGNIPPENRSSVALLDSLYGYYHHFVSRSVPVLHGSPRSCSRCVSLGFLPLPCVRFSPLRSPHPCSRFPPSLTLPLPSCTFAAWSPGTVCVFPPKGSVPFSPVSPRASFPFLASGYPHVGSTAASSPTGDSTVPRSPFGFRFYLSDFADQLLWPAGLPKRAHTTPPERQSQQGKRRQLNLSLYQCSTVEIRVAKR